MPWVQLKAAKYISRHGELRMYAPGEWVEVGSQAAREWIDAGEAVLAEAPPAALDGEAWGVAARDEAGAKWAQNLANRITGTVNVAPLMVALGEELPYERTLLVAGDVRLRPELVAVGVAKLDLFQMVVPTLDYGTLARDAAHGEVAEYVAGVVHDLRCLLYDTRQVFVRRSGDTLEFLKRWREELAPCGGDERLAFLVAYYKTKPLALATPMTWWAGRDAAP